MRNKPSATVWVVVILGLLTLQAAASAQMPPVGIIDFYGLRHIPEQQARAALQIQEGASVPDSEDAARLWMDAAKRRVRALPAVKDVELNVVCCDAGRTILYVGIVEAGAGTMTFARAPRGGVRLPDDVVRAGAALDDALMAAVVKGDAGEDDTHGHALSSNAAMRAVQEQFIVFAARDEATLRDVLAHSSDAAERALAAEVLGYLADKKRVVPALSAAMRDPDDSVRNNAMRALAVIAVYAAGKPQLGIRVPPEPFVDLLNSRFWTDRNKAAFALVELSQTRDPKLLTALHDRALTSLVEMARWKSRVHASASVFILGRLAAMTDEAIAEAWARNDREIVVSAAGARRTK